MGEKTELVDLNRLKKDIEERIHNKRNELQNISVTLQEVEDYGYNVVFGMETDNDSIKAGFQSGRAIGNVEGEIYQLQDILSCLDYYKKEE